MQRKLLPGPRSLSPPSQGSRRIWWDSVGRLWVSQWNVGQLGHYDPATGAWAEWPLPGSGARPYGVYVDEWDLVPEPVATAA